VGSRPDTTVPGIRPLLSVKYLFDCRDVSQRGSIDMPGWVPDGEQLGIKVWRNTNYIPFGFTYSGYITQDQLKNSPNKDRILLKGILLNDNQIKTYSKYLPMVSNSFSENIDDAELKNLCIQRNKYTCSSFNIDNYGYSAKIILDKPNLVFFSVPYDKGWTATVDGTPIKIEQVNVGFMAVLCPAGTSSIRFNYMTPGLFTGIEITGVSILVLVGYLLIFRYIIEPKRRTLTSLKVANFDEDENDNEEQTNDANDGADIPNIRQAADENAENNSENNEM
jgi:hypothetical protein